jgi:hypothetical protein
MNNAQLLADGQLLIEKSEVSETTSPGQWDPVAAFGSITIYRRSDEDLK